MLVYKGSHREGRDHVGLSALEASWWIHMMGVQLQVSASLQSAGSMEDLPACLPASQPASQQLQLVALLKEHQESIYQE